MMNFLLKPRNCAFKMISSAGAGEEWPLGRWGAQTWMLEEQLFMFSGQMIVLDVGAPAAGSLVKSGSRSDPSQRFLLNDIWVLNRVPKTKANPSSSLPSTCGKHPPSQPGFRRYLSDRLLVLSGGSQGGSATGNSTDQWLWSMQKKCIQNTGALSNNKSELFMHI